jgi:hypothetical protein
MKSLLAATTNQKSSFRKVPHFVSGEQGGNAAGLVAALPKAKLTRHRIVYRNSHSADQAESYKQKLTSAIRESAIIAFSQVSASCHWRSCPLSALAIL